MPVVPVTYYPSIESVLDLARIHMNDAFGGGAGLDFTDNYSSVLPLLNDSIAHYIRKLHTKGVSSLTKEQFYFNIPPVNGPQGVGVPDPSIQQYMNYAVFNDGAQNYANPVIPVTMLVPLNLWQRQNGSNLNFGNFPQAQDALKSTFQNVNLGEWEWRGDSIYWNGSLVPMDIRMRFLATIIFFPSTTPVAYFPTTPIPLRDCVEALAYLVAWKFCSSRLPAGGAADLKANADEAMDDVVNRYVRRGQGVVHSREAYGDDGGGWLGFS